MVKSYTYDKKLVKSYSYGKDLVKSYSYGKKLLSIKADVRHSRWSFRPLVLLIIFSMPFLLFLFLSPPPWLLSVRGLLPFKNQISKALHRLV